MAYFSTWKPHGNRVSKTWFITFIYLKEELRTSENIEKKKKKQREKIETKVAPRQRALSDLLWSDLNLNLSLYFFFFGCSESFERPRPHPGSTQPRLLPFLSNQIWISISLSVVFWLQWKLWTKSRLVRETWT